MTDILIRDVNPEVVLRLDEEASRMGLSRNELLKRRLEADVQPTNQAKITAADWARSRELLADLADPEVMDQAWR